MHVGIWIFLTSIWTFPHAPSLQKRLAGSQAQCSNVSLHVYRECCCILTAQTYMRRALEYYAHLISQIVLTRDVSTASTAHAFSAGNAALLQQTVLFQVRRVKWSQQLKSEMCREIKLKGESERNEWREGQSVRQLYVSLRSSILLTTFLKKLYSIIQILTMHAHSFL